MTDATTTAIEEQTTEHGPVDTRELWIAILVSSVVGVMTIVAGIVIYANFGDRFLERRYDSVGEVLMREGGRLEEARMYDAALDKYNRALQARFAGEFNRIHVLKRAGIILWEQGETEQALPYLREAVTGPHADRGAYFALVMSLIQTKQFDEAQEYIEHWRQHLTKGEQPRDYARLLYCKGRIAEAQGDPAAALGYYEESDVLRFGEESAARLAELLAEQGDREKALFYLERCFRRGVTGPEGDSLRRLQSRLRAETAS